MNVVEMFFWVSKSAFGKILIISDLFLLQNVWMISEIGVEKFGIKIERDPNPVPVPGLKIRYFRMITISKSTILRDRDFWSKDTFSSTDFENVH